MLRRADSKRATGPLRNRDLAVTFGIDASLISKVRNGHARLTSDQAQKIVERVGAGEQELQALLEASATLVHGVSVRAEALPAPTVFPLILDELRDATADRDGPPPLILIEYRDIPKTTKRSPHEELAPRIARAIADGVHVAMFQPFGNVLPSTAGVAPRFAEYVGELILAVRQNYRQLFSAALEILAEENPMDPDARAVQARALRSRFVLYEMSGPVPLVSGLQTRLMYTELTTAERQRRTAVWDWVGLRHAGKTEHGDLLVERDAESLSPSAVFDQFAPISTYWRSKGRLPVADEIDKAYEVLAPGEGPPVAERRWVQFKEA